MKKKYRKLKPGEFVIVPKGIKPASKEYSDWFKKESGRCPITGNYLTNPNNKEK